MQEIQRMIAATVKKVFQQDISVEITRPDEQFGDFATNVALQLAGKLGQNPHQIATQLVSAVKDAPGVSEVTVAGPGFINIRLHNKVVFENAQKAVVVRPQTYKGKVVVAEYGDPNPFKILHAGHLYTAVVGDAVANLLEVSGAKVHRVNFGGDVGLHVGRAMWAILQELGGEYPEKLKTIPGKDRAGWMSACYVSGTAAYEDNPTAQQEIRELNKRVYKIHETDDRDSAFAQIYWTCRQWSYDYFDYFYARLNSHFEKYYPESQVAPIGTKTVQTQLKKGVYEQSDGAVVFKGEPHGLHTRVFITRDGLPTYEAKDVGLIMAKWQDYHFDTSLIITANDQAEYMKVVLKSIEQFKPGLAERSVHLTHGILKLVGGVKMSSRKGNILRAIDILDAAAAANKKAHGTETQEVTVSAVKYAFLRQRIGGDVLYDPAESVSLEGNSGPYLQYAHSRALSILAKAGEVMESTVADLEPAERSLACKIGEYPEVIANAAQDFMPHHVCTYLFELAQTFNRFYEKNRVVGSKRQAARLQLVAMYANVLKDGLAILNIPAPDRM